MAIEVEAADGIAGLQNHKPASTQTHASSILRSAAFGGATSRCGGPASMAGPSLDDHQRRHELDPGQQKSPGRRPGLCSPAW
ncbi:hypothetical protein, partial [Amycolatopsis solani]|uniref:hypothetical protein n=1 Tax=Amycolatopsis solani TaxID=3028615 RepID=UPI0025B16FB1